MHVIWSGYTHATIAGRRRTYNIIGEHSTCGVLCALFAEALLHVIYGNNKYCFSACSHRAIIKR